METIVSKSKIDKCFEEYNNMKPNFIKKFRSHDKDIICKLKNLIRKEEIGKKIWETSFGSIEYLKFDILSKDDCIYYFLTLEENMALKSPGIWRVLKDHY